MEFLADECCHFGIVAALRASGHDVLSVAELARGAKDEAVIDLSLSHRRILLTEDRDFGRLGYANARRSGGVTYLRYPAPTWAGVAEMLDKLVADRSSELRGAFVVVQPGRIRVGRQPGH